MKENDTSFLEEDKVILQATVSTGTSIKYVKERKGIPFSKVGRLNTMHSDYSQYDIVDLLAKVNKEEFILFAKIKNRMDYRSNLSTVEKQPPGSASTLQGRRVTTLVKVGLVKRTGVRGELMINPNIIQPGSEVQDRFMAKWDDL